jgi:hypothetical protein
MAGPSWITGTLAAVMILTAAYSASRLAGSRLRGLATETDTDGLHALMGTAMAGMLVPRLTLLPASAWAMVFGAAAAWFGACALRSRTTGTSNWRCRYPVPHLVECIAMLYMLLAVPAAQARPGMAMPGMGVAPGEQAGFPALAVVLALFILGYLMWTTDQLATLARARAITAGPATIPEHPALVTVPAGSGPASMSSTAGSPGAIPTAGQAATAGQVQLAPGLAAASKIVMSIAMVYMLLLML